MKWIIVIFRIFTNHHAFFRNHNCKQLVNLSTRQLVNLSTRQLVNLSTK